MSAQTENLTAQFGALTSPNMNYSQRTSTTGPAAASLSKEARFDREALPHLNDLHRAAARILGERDKANDLVQETYLRAWRSFDRYQAGTNCRAWLFRILFNGIRRQRRDWFKWITGKDEDVSMLDQIAPPPVHEALTDNAILRALDQLPEQFRAVVVLVDVEEFTYKEVSDILRIPVGTVMSRLSRARGVLHTQLEDVARSYGIRAGSAC